MITVTVNVNGVFVTMPITAKVDWKALPNERLTGEKLVGYYDKNGYKPLFWGGPIEIDAR